MAKTWTRGCSCPECGDSLPRPTDDGLVVCDCGAHCWVEIDGDADVEGRWFNIYRVTLEAGPCPHHWSDWRTCFTCSSAQAES